MDLTPYASTVQLSKFTPRCYGFIISTNNRVLVTREFWRGTPLSKLPGGGLELGESLEGCLDREMEEEFLTYQKVNWSFLHLPTHFFTSDFKPDEQLLLFYFLGEEHVDEDAFSMRVDDNLLGIEWLPLEPKYASWFTLETDRKAFLRLLEVLNA